jgi:hypothetical protein
MVESQDLRDDRESRLEAWLKNEQLSFKSSRDLIDYLKELEQGFHCHGTGLDRGANVIVKDFFLKSSRPLCMPLEKMKNNVKLLSSIKKVQECVMLARANLLRVEAKCHARCRCAPHSLLWRPGNVSCLRGSLQMEVTL